MNVNTTLDQVLEKFGRNTTLDGILLKRGRLPRGIASDAKDVVGFDYILHHDQNCYECYVANPPLFGATQPVPVPCPLGLAMIQNYEINYTRAIEIFHTGNWGGKFISIALSRPLHPDVKEPYWHFRSNLGVQIMIGANTGKVIEPK